MVNGKEKQRQRRAQKGKQTAPGWMKYAFILTDAVIVIGAVWLISGAVSPLKKPETEASSVQESADRLDTDRTETEATDGRREINVVPEALTEEHEDAPDTAEESEKPEEEPDAAASPDGSSGEPAGAAEPQEEPAAPETEPETPAETQPPETAPAPPPETQPPETQPPETQPPAPQVTSLAYVGNIHALSQDQINAIRASYDCNGRGYGGITYYQAAPSVQSQMDSMGINCRALVPGGNTVALTFQEGWEPGYTGQLLDILAQKGVKANFYITHGYAASRPDLVWRMINEGHTVGSHTYSCPDTPIAYFNLEDIMNDAMQMQQYVHNTFGYDMHAYNYNSGAWSPGSAKMLSDMGYTVVLCSNSYSDYNAYTAIDPNVWLPQLEAGLIPGSIYAFHVTNPVTIQMIGPLIDYIRSRGFTFVLI